MTPWWENVDWTDPINRDCSLNAGLVGWWMGAPSLFGGTRLWDLCGKNHGTLTNMDPATDWVPTERGMALDFDGSDDYVSIPAMTWNPDQASYYSAGYWNGGESFPRVFNGSASTLMNFNGTGTTTLSFQAHSGTAAQNSSNSLATGNRFRVAAVRDRAASIVRFVFNDVTTTRTSIFGGAGSAVSQSMILGNESGTTRTLNGQIEYFMIFAQAHSENLSREILSQGERGFPEMLNRPRRRVYSVTDGAPPATGAGPLIGSRLLHSRLMRRLVA